jgi:UMF1 family MFS transporter
VTTEAESSSRRERIAWYFYDWANSAFATTVLVVFLGPYLTTIAKAAADGNGFIYPLGIKLSAGSYFPYVVSTSVFLQVICLPVLGAIADYSNRKKQLLAFFANVGAFATMAMYFLHGTRYLLGGILFVIANLSFGAAKVFYNAFLPEIAPPERRDSVSSIGWAVGYLGGGILLAANLLLLSQASALGISETFAVRISLLSAGIWWAVFTIVPLLYLRTREPAKAVAGGRNYLSAGFKQLVHTLRGTRAFPYTILFLIAYFFYNDGIQTVIALASQFGQEELKLSLSLLTILVLMIQFVAFVGALAFNLVAKAMGTKTALIISLVIWTGVVVYAFGFLETATEFFVLGGVIGIVLGGSQALSRSLYSQMIPKGKESEYFSLYEVSEGGSSWLGPLIFGLGYEYTRSYRISILSLALFFIVGVVLLAAVNLRKATQDVWQK